MDPYFVILGMTHIVSIKKPMKHDHNEVTKAWDAAKRVFTGFATASVGLSIIEADYIFIPCSIKDAH